MSDLANILAMLYPESDQARLFLRNISMNPDQVNLDGGARLRWERILDEAWKRHLVEKLVEVASQEYANLRPQLFEAMYSYLSGRGGTVSKAKTQPSITRPGLIRYFLDRWLPDFHRFLTRVGTLSEPSELHELEEYLSDFHSKINQEMHEKTYLPLRSKQLPPVLPTQIIDRDPFVSPVHQIILHLAGRAQGGDSASAQIAAANRRSKVVRNILTVLDRTPEPLILLGEPGSGKTMTLQQAAMALADKERRRVFPRIPIYVRLGEFHVERRVEPEDVLEYVRQSSPASIQSRLDALDHNGRLVIFFDGMDEMSRDRYGAHTEALSRFADRYIGSQNSLPSLFADTTKSLFSCRITDFSPNFRHQRLVLLPFDYKQIIDYLDEYIESFPVIIDGKAWKLNELAKYIARGDLSIEANNPFVLWLLCLYLQLQKSWPGSRVELLRFYNEQNYQRKDEEIQRNNKENSTEDHPFPDMESAFQEWARFAYMIAERDLGPISVSELEQEEDSATVHEMIRVGKRCGILAESKEGHTHLIRFQHHRFQEYFAAFHIDKVRPDIDWLNRFDAPRWQETMLNLILMGEAEDVVRTFAGSIEKLAQDCKAEVERILEENEQKEVLKKEAAEKKAKEVSILKVFGRALKETMDEPRGLMFEAVNFLRGKVVTEPVKEEKKDEVEDQSDSNDKEEFEKSEVVLPDMRETILADRVELSSRIIRHVGSRLPIVGEVLMPPFREAVELLAEYGTPITQVKMMRACQNVPEMDFIENLRKPLNSPINWVRNQALILIAGSGRNIGTNLATEIGYDLANGMFPARVGAYAKAVKESGNRKYWWSLAVGAFCYLTNVLLLFAMAVTIYIGAWSMRSVYIENPQPFLFLDQFRLSDWTYFREDEWKIGPEIKKEETKTRPSDYGGFSILDQHIYIFIFGLVVLIATGITLNRQPSLLWAYVVGSALGIVILMSSLVALWNGYWSFLTSILGAILIFGAAIIGIVTLLATTIHFSVLSVYLVATARIRQSGHALTTFLAGAWRSCHFGSPFAGILAIIVTFPTLGLILLVSVAIIQVLSDISHLPFHPLVNISLLLMGVILIVSLVRAIRVKSISPLRRFLNALVRGIQFLLVGTIVLAVFGLAVAAIVHLFLWLANLPIWPSGIWFGLLRILIAIVSLGLIFISFRFLWRTIKSLWFQDTQPFPPGSFKPEDWKEIIETADADRQNYFLSRTNHQTLSVTPHQLLNILKEIRPLISKEPALSTYWNQRDQLEQVLRQERH